jgi:drug/metabolite transporter (DMT)-like permease
VATYAFVNPVVAMALGWAIGGESLTARMLTAAAVVLAAVMTITSARPAARGAAAPAGAGAVPARRP